MALLSEKDLRELEDAKIASQPRLTTKNAKQFGRLSACLHMIEISVEDNFSKSQLKEAKQLVDEIFEDLNGIDYV
jgi:predicted ATPase